MAFICEALSVPRRTVNNWLSEGEAELGPLGRLTKRRLLFMMEYADGINDLLRIAAIARHYPDDPQQAASNEIWEVSL